MGKEQKSPVPVKDAQPEVPVADGLPLVPGTATPIKQIRFLDYGDIRVVFDTDTNIALGVMAVPK